MFFFTKNISYREGKINYFEKFFTSIYPDFLYNLHNYEKSIKKM